MTKSRYFPGLAFLRFYAAMSVVLAHCAGAFPELRPYEYAGAAIPEWLTLGGYSAVNLFFVLSGFLVTYLLIQERQQSSTVSVQNFYWRRVLRIWALYYLIAFIGLIAMPLLLGNRYPYAPLPFAQTAGVLLLMPSFANAGMTLGAISHLWSIGIEELFYLVLPWMVKLARRPMWIAVAIIGVRFLVEAIVTQWGDDTLKRVVWDTRFECMVVGAATAYLYVYKPALCRILYQRTAQLYMALLFVLLIFFDLPSTVLFNLATSVIFASIILNVATNPKALFRLESPRLRYLGDISYGVYMFHYPVLYLVMTALQGVGWQYDLLLYPLVIGLTLACAILSYRFYESPFLRLKARFQSAPDHLLTPATD